MKINIQLLHPDAKVPKQSHDTDAGYDIFAIDDGTLVLNSDGTDVLYIEYGTGIAIQPEFGYHIEILPRSSITKKDLILKNSIGLIDPDYTQEIKFRFQVFGDNNYKKGDRIGQIVIRKTIYADFNIVDKLEATQRKGGLGSTGK